MMTATITVDAKIVAASLAKALVQVAVCFPSQQQVLVLLVVEAGPNLQTSLWHLGQAQHLLLPVKVIDQLSVSDI
jgi:hypothetical protein